MEGKELSNAPEEEQEQHLKRKSKKKKIIIVICIIILFAGILCATYFMFNKKEKEPEKEVEVTDKKLYAPYRIVNNDINDFDLYFMQLENNGKNMIYSPLSIKYTLGMLAEGAKGETKSQITNIIGKYKSNKYINNKNMSFANAMFIRDTFKKNVKEDYINNLKNKYSAEVVFDSFKTPDTINNWVSNKTLKLINNLFDEAPDNDFMLVNALAIDMEWVNKIRDENEDYDVHYSHRDFYTGIAAFLGGGHQELKFKGAENSVKSIEIGAVANRYDIINELGEDNIRNEITKEYQAWLDNGAENGCANSAAEEPSAKEFVDNYMKELAVGYKDVTSSTDFTFYDGDDEKVFAKDLKTYNGTTLQYVGIMPKKDELKTYIKNANAKKINELINNLKSIELDSFKDRVVTHITGFIPVFNYDYKLDLNKDLTKLGIINIFDSKKADLTNLSKGNAYIGDTLHKATIDFSNDGIKAAAVTVGGGKGDGMCGFDHIYKMPVEEIDMTFDKPYIYIIRDKKSGEVWFAGSVYEPTKYEPDPSM